TPMSVQIAKRAQIDQYIERQRVAAAVLAEQIVVPSARAGREIEHLVDPRLRQAGHQPLNLAEAAPTQIMAVQEGGNDLAQRAPACVAKLHQCRSVGCPEGIEQLNGRRRKLRGYARGEIGGLGVLDQRRRGWWLRIVADQ